MKDSPTATDYQIESKEEKGCRIGLVVTVGKDEVAKAYKQAIKHINKEISLPGFRKGKAPDHVIIQKYSASLDKEWKELVVNAAFRAGLKHTNRYPYSQSSIEKPRIEKCSLEEGAVVHLSYESFPQVPTIEFKEISLPHIEKKNVTEKEVEEIVKEVQQTHAGWEEITEKRAVQEGDYVDLSIDEIETDSPHPIVQKRRFEVSPLMVSWLKKLLLGKLSVGESADGETYPDESKSEEEKKAFKHIKVRVTLHAIHKILLPEINDELAKKTGADNKEDLITKIRSNLEKDAALKQKEEKIVALENALIAKYPFDIPSSLLASEINDRVNQKIGELKENNTPEEKIEEEKPKITEWARTHAEESIRLHFILRELGDKGKVTVSQDELNEKINHEILRNPYYQRLIKESPEKLKDLIRNLSTYFQNEKIREWALSQVEQL